jgi:excisionase family DNA binding protein
MHSTIETPRLMTVKEAAKYLCISERKLWSMTQAGEIPAVRLGRAVRYDLNDLDSFIQRAKGISIS